jgi:hypothetical protein
MMVLRVGLALGLGCLGACESAELPAGAKQSAGGRAAVQQEPPKDTRPAEPERAFGAPLTQTQALDVAEVLADPTPHLGKVVQCTGVVARVCERAGCWLELRPTAGGEQGLRVPMAGHAFFVPQDAVGRPASVEGRLSARALGDGERAHLVGEGLKATGPLSLSATGVVIR